MFCRNCGNKLDGGEKFCKGCGNSIGNYNEIPKGVKGWSWGAFAFAPLWGISHKLWFSLLAFIPYVNFIIAIILGIKGREWAWKKFKSKDVEKFKRKQRGWNIAALVVFIISLIGIFSSIILVSLDSAREKATNAVDSAESTFTSDLTNKIASSVVNISCEDVTTEEVFGGSGTILTAEGIIITNSHVIPQSEEYLNVPDEGCIIILPDPISGQPSEFYLAQPIVIPGLSDDYDIAYLEIYDALLDDDGFTKLGDYPREFPVFDDSLRCELEDVKLGEPIRVFGYPQISGGYSLTITDGVVSSFSEDFDLIYTSAKISNGNSGGLAVDDKGCMLGIPTMVSSDENESLGIILSMNLVYRFSEEVDKFLAE